MADPRCYRCEGFVRDLGDGDGPSCANCGRFQPVADPPPPPPPKRERPKRDRRAYDRDYRRTHPRNPRPLTPEEQEAKKLYHQVWAKTRSRKPLTAEQKAAMKVYKREYDQTHTRKPLTAEQLEAKRTWTREYMREFRQGLRRTK